MTLNRFDELEARFSYHFESPDFLEQALTHRSFFFENRSHCSGHNERLEFLGDAVLDLSITTELMRIYPEESEGVLSKWRASLVNEASLAEKALELGLGSLLRVGRGEQASGTANRPRLLASCFEAVVGAIYSDGGWMPAHVFISGFFTDQIRYVSASNEFEADYKTRLQERVQKQNQVPPDYRILKTEGPDHDKTFFVEVSVLGEALAVGQGPSRKQAEQQAARSALEKGRIEK